VVLAALLDAGVDVADDRQALAHDLALEREQQPQHPVGGRVVRAHVDREELGLRLDLGAEHRRARLVHPLQRDGALAVAVRDAQRRVVDVGRRLRRVLLGDRRALVSHTSAARRAR
jgi:hypothetical protein